MLNYLVICRKLQDLFKGYSWLVSEVNLSNLLYCLVELKLKFSDIERVLQITLIGKLR